MPKPIFIKPTEKHPKGGWWCKYTIRKGDNFFKSEKKIWVEDYSTPKAAELAANAVMLECYNNALAKAEGYFKEQQEAQKKASRDVWTLEAVALDRIEKYGDASMGSYFREIIRLCGQTLPEDFEKAYWGTIKYLKETPQAPKTTNKDKVTVKNKMRSEVTINRYKSVFRMIFKHAVIVKACTPDMVLIKYDLEPEEGRDRVWTLEEKKRLFEALKGSWLEMAVYFSQFNPIRASDLFKLKKIDWKPELNRVQFQANKTKRTKNRDTILKQIDQRLRDYFASLPESCEWLFPRITESGFCYKIKKHSDEWERVCKRAGIEDFHFHDLKHCAITYLLDHGYSRQDLKQCGIQYSDKMIDKYYHFDADKAPVLPGFEKPGLKLFEREA